MGTGNGMLIPPDLHPWPTKNYHPSGRVPVCHGVSLKHTLKKKGRAFRNIGTEKYISLTVKSALLLYYLSPVPTPTFGHWTMCIFTKHDASIYHICDCGRLDLLAAFLGSFLQTAADIIRKRVKASRSMCKYGSAARTWTPPSCF